MKKLVFLIFMIMILAFTTCYVQADCTKEEISSLKKEAEKIKVTYKHLGGVEVEGGTTEYSHFNLIFTNLNNYMYLKDNYGNIVKADNNSDTVILQVQTGSYKYFVFSERCEVLLKKLNIVLPKFNIYSLDPLCEGIDGDDFALCGKYYNYDVSYGTFKDKIDNYKKQNNIKSDNDGLDEDEDIVYYLENIYDYIVSNLLYFIYGLMTILIFIFLIIIIKKRKSRGVLK